MKCHFLGTGGSVNSPDRHNTSLCLETTTKNDGGTANNTVLIDCNGVCVQRLGAAGIAFEDLAHIFLTHEHIDHIAALPNLIHQIWVKSCLYAQTRRSHALNFYGNASTLKSLRALIDSVNLPRHPYMFPMEFHELAQQGGTLNAGNITLDYFPVNHGPTPCFGLTTEGEERRLVYSGDTEPVPAIYRPLQDGDILIHDCNKIDAALNQEHTTWAQLESLLPDLPDITLYLVHLPLLDQAADAAFRKKLFDQYGDRVIVGTDSMMINF